MSYFSTIFAMHTSTSRWRKNTIRWFSNSHENTTRRRKRRRGISHDIARITIFISISDSVIHQCTCCKWRICSVYCKSAADIHPDKWQASSKSQSLQVKTTEICDEKMFIKEESEHTSCPDECTTKNEDADEQRGLCSFLLMFFCCEQY